MQRKLLFQLRMISAAAAILLRGRKRYAAWAIHDLLWLYPTLRRNCSWHGPVVTRFETDEPHVWLTIDDGPDRRDTPDILDLLKSYDARASFFVIGKKVEENRALARKILSAGHSLENHTYTHPAATFWGLPCCAVSDEIDRCTHALRVATGIVPRFFRPPVGMINAHIHPITSKRWLRVIGWSANGWDGLANSLPQVVVRKIMRQVSPGAIILIHESGESLARVQTIELVLEALSKKGYRCVIPKNSSLY